MNGIPVPEHVSVVLSAIFQALLGRDPSADEAASIAPTLVMDNGIAKVLRDIIASGEFKDIQFKRNSPQYVNQIYQGLLNREPDPGGLEAYSSKITNDRELAPTIRSIVSSREFINNVLTNPDTQTICIVYQLLTGKPAPADISDWKHLADVLANVECYQTLVNLRSTLHYTADDFLDTKLVLLHHPKTGGSTLHKILIESYAHDAICPERFNGLKNYSAGSLVKYKLFSGHFDLQSVHLIPGRKQIITMLREPVARLVSLYYFQRAHLPEVIEKNNMELARVANACSMKDFFEHKDVCCHPSINNSMTRVLTEVLPEYRWEGHAIAGEFSVEGRLDEAIAKLDSLDAFGILERYDDSISMIFDVIKKERPALIKKEMVLDDLMQIDPGLRVIEREPITKETLEAIEALVVTDKKLYEHACNVFDMRFRRCYPASDINGCGDMA